MQINPDNGRFSPMIQQEFFFISLFADQAWQYYLIAFLVLLLVVGLCLAIIPLESLADRLLLIAAFIFTAAFAVPAAGLIYAEINILIGLCLFMNLAYNYNQYLESKQNTNRAFLASVGMIFCVAYLIYVKEPMFLVFVGYPMISIIFKTFLNVHCGQISTRHDFKRFLFVCGNEIAILGLSVVYGLVYFFYIFLQTKERYGKEQGLGLLDSFLTSLHNPWVVIYLVSVIWRCLQIKRGSSRFDPVLDSMSLSFLLPYLAINYLGLTGSYYYLPIVFMGMILLTKTATPVSQKMRFRVGLAILCVAIIVSSLPSFFSFFRQRDLYMQTRQLSVELVDELIAKASAGSQPKIYFFERNQGYDVGQFVSFINFSLIDRNFFTEKLPNLDFSQNGIPVIPASGVDNKLNSLEEFRNLAEATGIPPSPGDLFIALPGSAGKGGRRSHSQKQGLQGAMMASSFDLELQRIQAGKAFGFGGSCLMAGRK